MLQRHSSCYPGSAKPGNSMLQNVIHTIRNLSEDAIYVGALLGHPRVAVPTAIYLLALTRFSTDAQISLLMVGFYIPAITGIFMPSMKYRLIGLGIGMGLGCQLAYLLISETNRMIREGCNPSPELSNYFEKYLFCRYGK